MRTNNFSQEKLLIAAVESGNFTLVRQWIEAGENINSKNSVNDSLLFIAAEKGYAEIALFLISQKADVHVLNNASQNTLHAACRSGSLKIIRALLSAGVNPNQPNSRGLLPISIAVKYNHPDVIEYFSKNELIPCENLQKLICFDSNIDLATLNVLLSLIQEDVSVQVKLLRELILFGLVQGVALFLRKYPALRSRLPLYFFEILQNFYLTQEDIDIEKYSIRSERLKFYIQEMWFHEVEKNEILSYLLKNGLAFNDFDEDGQTIFHVACGFCQDEYPEVFLITGLLKHDDPHDYPIDIKNRRGQTPLHYAIERGFFFHALYLIICGADVRAQDVEGKSALDYAKFFRLYDHEKNNGDSSLDKLDHEYREALVQIIHDYINVSGMNSNSS